jgi:galactose mutarotase-like enzyme
VVVPQLGGKIASLAVISAKGRAGAQLLQGMLKPYAARTPQMPFDASDGSGWDECLPSVAPCEIEHDGETVEIPDHGDFWRLDWKVEERSEEKLCMSATGTSLPLHFERVIELEANRVKLSYLVRNDGETTVPWAWSAHPLLAVDPGDRIILPHSIEEITTGSSANGRLGEPGSTHAWPFTADARNGEALDLTTVGQPTDGVGDKIMTPAPKEGWCAVDRLSHRVRVTLRFDPVANPWLGLWICYGGWPVAAAVRKGFTVALEPCTIPVDSLAEAIENGTAPMLAAGEEKRWELTLEVTPREI